MTIEKHSVYTHASKQGHPSAPLVYRMAFENSANQNNEFPKYAFELISHEGSDFIIDLEKKINVSLW